MGALGEDGLKGALALGPEVVAAVVVDHASLDRDEQHKRPTASDNRVRGAGVKNVRSSCLQHAFR